MRKAFTLVELIVVIGIITIVIGLLLPAIQMAREAARRIQCTNHQKQLATALLDHENNKGSFPGWREFTTMVLPGDGDDIAGQASWVFSILPFFEQTELFEFLKNGLMDQPVPKLAILHCPSHAVENTSRAMTYVVNGGAVDAPYAGNITVDISVANGPFLDRAGIVAAGAGGNYEYTYESEFLAPAAMTSKHRSTVARIEDITKMDGTSYTLMTSENVQRGFWISSDLIHFYNDRGGNVLANSASFFPLNGQDAVALTGFGLDDIEGSVAFCWSRGEYDADRMCYPRDELRDIGNPKRGFVAMQPPPPSPKGTYVPPFDDSWRIPAYLGLFPWKTYTGSWYQSARPASYHAGAVVASFCDGSVRNINWDIDEHVFVQLMTAGDRRSDAGWRFDAGENFLQGRLFDAKDLKD